MKVFLKGLSLHDSIISLVIYVGQKLEEIILCLIQLMGFITLDYVMNGLLCAL